MRTEDVPAKLLGAGLTFLITIAATMLPYRLKIVAKHKLKGVKCFCGGLFLALCFIHLLPDVMKSFNKMEKLAALQKAYPLAELTICAGLLLVLTIERMAHVFDRAKKKEGPSCNASSDCYKEKCNMSGSSETNPLVVTTSVSYGSDVQTGGEVSINRFAQPTGNLTFVDHNYNPATLSNKTLVEAEQQSTLDENRQHSTCEQSVGRGNKVRELCLIIALMIHSILEGLAVGLQYTTVGLVSILVLIAVHKSLLGFSLGVSLADSRAPFLDHLKNAVIFSVANPLGIILGVLILFGGWTIVVAVAMAFLTALATGSFMYITFFEILGRELRVVEKRDLLNLVYCLCGFSSFACITAIPGAQS